MYKLGSIMIHSIPSVPEMLFDAGSLYLPCKFQPQSAYFQMMHMLRAEFCCVIYTLWYFCFVWPVTDVEAVYTKPPDQPGAERIKVYTPEYDIQIGQKSTMGRGGMSSKINAARCGPVLRLTWSIRLVKKTKWYQLAPFLITACWYVHVYTYRYVKHIEMYDTHVVDKHSSVSNMHRKFYTG